MGAADWCVVPDDEFPAWLRLATFPATLAIGALVTLQSTVNGKLAEEVGHGPRAGVLAAAISFGLGLVLLLLLYAALPSWRRAHQRIREGRREGRLRRFQMLGGLGGASLVASQGLTVTQIGVAVFVVAVVAGQTSSALAVDHVGLSPTGKAPITGTRLLGAGIVVVAVVVSSGALFHTGASAGLLALALLPLLAGAFTAGQQAVNAHVASVGSVGVATLNNFVVGTCALVVVLALSLLLPGHLNGLPGQPWLYVGGIIGVLFISMAALFVRLVGVLVFGLGAIAGQVITAVVVDLLTDPSKVTTATYVGAALTLLGTVVAALGSRLSRSRR